MMEFWKRVLVDIILFIALAGLFAGAGMFYITNAWIAPLTSFALAILNVAVKPILVILSLPIDILTLGFFNVAVNGVMLQLASMLAGSASFHFSSFDSAMLIAIIMAIFDVVIINHEDRL